MLNPAAFADNRAKRSDIKLSLHRSVQSKSAATVGEFSETICSPIEIKASSSLTAFMTGLKFLLAQKDFKLATSWE